MCAGKYIGLLLFVILIPDIYTQESVFSVYPAEFSSSANDEFGPVYFKDGIVFCSNTSAGSAVAIKSGEKRLFNLMYARRKDSADWRTPILLSKELTTIFNEGPATFTIDNATIYYARNTFVDGKLKDINDPSNKLGIFSANLIDGKWQNIQPFPYNNIEHSLGTPCINQQGNRLYFASDMPGGFGGTDIYFSEYKDGKWQHPVNLGETINTVANESYPFICEAGRLFFASDKPGGYGGKDIYYTYSRNGEWLKPVLLEKEINSEFDDYGLITNAQFKNGYISTNRHGKQDILFFNAEVPQFTFCEKQKENERCFEFYDERYIDTLFLEYEWDFGDGVKKTGFKVKHCFDRGGYHDVKLTVMHKIADTVIQIPSIYSFELEDEEQAYMNTPDVWILNEPMYYSSRQTNLPNIDASGYYWDFGSGFRINKAEGQYTFSSVGEKQLRLGVTGYSEEDKKPVKECVSKSILILEDIQAVTGYYEPVNNFGLVDKENFRGWENIPVKAYVFVINSNVQKYELEEKMSQLSELLVNTEERALHNNSYPVFDVISDCLHANNNIKLVIALHYGENKSFRKNKEITDSWKDILQEYIKEMNYQNYKIEVVSYGSSRMGLDKKDRDKSGQARWVELIMFGNNQ